MQRADLQALFARVGEFYITDKTMRNAQKKMEAALKQDEIDHNAQSEYLAAVQKYFDAFQKEARMHLRDVDKRLEHVNQMHFNLTAERGVAVRRIEATQEVLAQLNSLEANGAG